MFTHIRFYYRLRPPPRSPLFPYTTLFRSPGGQGPRRRHHRAPGRGQRQVHPRRRRATARMDLTLTSTRGSMVRSEEHTSELQSRGHLVCRLLLEKKKKSSPTKNTTHMHTS